jgi:hypothetical protein
MNIYIEKHNIYLDEFERRTSAMNDRRRGQEYEELKGKCVGY